MQNYCDYQTLIDNAMRSVIKNVLKQIEKDGLKDDHHFYIHFKTHHPGVKISSKLQLQYPDELIIVLQHQFDNLVVSEDSFSVSLSFNGIKENLNIPFSAITSFSDPSVHFVLQLDNDETIFEDFLDEEDETDYISSNNSNPSIPSKGIHKEGNVIDITEMLKNR